MLTAIFIIYLMGCILAYFNIRRHNALCSISKQLEEVKMSLFSSFASWFYFLVQYHTFGVGELPDDLVQETNEEPIPDCSKHFNDHLFLN